ncbi:four helix bundle protein [Candidatus Dojkabacteria bacterium]|uniref:Four helix bundle protein n=1 Tax=Candidatus Dojkabacteria bacterium TaxID=2099670 RepID=A0A955RLS8_9BACT|nr:four helix bundle protein [Candidatus Dojkabacteria bacterium]
MYKLTDTFPKEERFSLVQQLRRCSSSISANIVEGACRNTDADFAHFLQISLGSASETKYFLLLSKDLGYIQEHIYLKLSTLTDETMKMLSSLISFLKANR